MKIQVDLTLKLDKELIKALEVENAWLKYEISFYDDFMKEMGEDHSMIGTFLYNYI